MDAEKKVELFRQGYAEDPETKKKGGFDYIPWSLLAKYLKTTYPDAVIGAEYHPETHMPQFLDAAGYGFVRVYLCLDGNSIAVRLDHPITNHTNKPIKNPLPDDVSNSLMRARAKIISMETGYGLRLWTQEDVPQDAKPAKKTPAKSASGAASASTASASNPDAPGKEDAMSLIDHCSTVEAVLSLYKRCEARAISEKWKDLLVDICAGRKNLLNGDVGKEAL